MTLLITVFAAVAATALWYGSDSRHQMKWGTLCWPFLGCFPHVAGGCHL